MWMRRLCDTVGKLGAAWEGEGPPEPAALSRAAQQEPRRLFFAPSGDLPTVSLCRSVARRATTAQPISQPLQSTVGVMARTRQSPPPTAAPGPPYDRVTPPVCGQRPRQRAAVASGRDADSEQGAEGRRQVHMLKETRCPWSAERGGRDRRVRPIAEIPSDLTRLVRLDRAGPPAARTFASPGGIPSGAL